MDQRSRTPRRDFLNRLAVGTCAASSFSFPESAFGQLSQQHFRVAASTRGVVATVNPLASQAAIDAYARGGNAIDAAVAASLMLSVVDSHNSGLGGGCLALIRTSQGKIHAIDGREKASLNATAEMFVRGGVADPKLSQTGPLAAGVPGLVAALYDLASRFGAVPWKGALNDAAKIAEEGFPIDEVFARNLASSADALRRFPDTARVVLDRSDRPLSAGAHLVQTDLARTLNKLSEEGTDWFYRGQFARQTARLMRDTGGVLSERDFDEYTVENREPISCSYRSNRVIGFPPPSSGGIHVAQMLGMLARFDVKSIFQESAAVGLHLLLEVMKRAMADRAHWLGDADFAKVPRGLLDEQYLRQRAGDIDLARASSVDGHGQPPNSERELFGSGKHTTHVATADSLGNIVALTQTINTAFGSKMIVPGTGVFLNNQMDDFSIAPGVRNAFGLVGSSANAVAPGKRPLSSMSPTIVLDALGKPILSCGAAGGPKIITTVLQLLVRTLDLGQSLEQSLAEPRVHHQWSPDSAVCESSLTDDVMAKLHDMGHAIERLRSVAVAQGVEFSAGDMLRSASDPRVPSSALGVE